MRTAFPDALVSGFDALIPSMTNDPKDRHVLACAVQSQASVILTKNLKDFPQRSCSPYGVTAVAPDVLLTNILEMYPHRVDEVLCAMSERRHVAGKKSADLYSLLASSFPVFSERALDRFGQPTSVPDLPFPAVEVPTEQAVEEVFGGREPGQRTPMGTAFLWLGALAQAPRNAKKYSCKSWTKKGLRAVAKEISSFGIASKQHAHPRSRGIAYVKLIPDPGPTMQLFAPHPLDCVYVMTLVLDGEFWYVWDVTKNYVPTSADVLGEGRGDQDPITLR